MGRLIPAANTCSEDCYDLLSVSTRRLHDAAQRVVHSYYRASQRKVQDSKDSFNSHQMRQQVVTLFVACFCSGV